MHNPLLLLLNASNSMILLINGSIGLLFLICSKARDNIEYIKPQNHSFPIIIRASNEIQHIIAQLY